MNSLSNKTGKLFCISQLTLFLVYYNYLKNTALWWYKTNFHSYGMLSFSDKPICLSQNNPIYLKTNNLFILAIDNIYLPLFKDELICQSQTHNVPVSHFPRFQFVTVWWPDWFLSKKTATFSSAVN